MNDSARARFVSISVAARRLDVCGETVRRWVKTGKLAGQRFPGGQFRVSVAAIERILNLSDEPPHPPHSA